MILTGQPYKRYTTTGSGSLRRGHHRWVLPTDRGELLTEDAARIIGLGVSAMVTRVNRVMNGIIPADKIFAPPGEAKAARKDVDHRIVTEEINRVPDEDIGKFSHLSDRPRDQRLRSIRGCGRWEARQ